MNIFLSNNPRVDRAVKDLPDQDSPTIPSDSPGLSLKDKLLIICLFVLVSFTLKSLNSRILMMISR